VENLTVDAAPDFERAYPPLQKAIERDYGVTCVRAPVQSGYFGDLNGAEIRIDQSLGPEDSLFTLLHLFGHTVQWNLEGVRDFNIKPGNLSEETIQDVIDYEHEACRYSMRLLQDQGFAHLEPWLSEYSAADLRHLLHYYRTGEQLGAQPFRNSGEPMMQPLEIPPFKAKVLRWRWDGIVV